MSEQAKFKAAQRAWDNMEPPQPAWMDEDEEEKPESPQEKYAREYAYQFGKLSREEQKLVRAQPGSLIALRLKWKVEDEIYKRNQQEADEQEWEQQQAYPKGRWS